MKKIIHHLRKQPEHVRRNILHILTLAFALILVLLWIYSLGVTITNPETTTKINQDLQPISSLKDNLVGGYNSFKEPSSNPQQ